MGSNRHVTIALGNSEQALNDMYAQVIRGGQPEIDFRFTVATTVLDFMRLASDSGTDLALFMPPGNIVPDPARPYTTPEEEAVHIVRTIRAKCQVPIICIAAYPVAEEAVLAAGADRFLYVPAQPDQIRSAVAACLKL